MKLTVFLRPQDDLASLAAAGTSEVLIGTLEHSRIGGFTNDQALNAATQARELGMRTVLVADGMVSEREFKTFTASLSQLVDSFDAVRALDPGVMQFLFESTNKPLQFVADTGNHNLTGLQRWESYFGDRLERLVISIELSKESLKQIIPSLKTPCELLVLGRILLFHSPRALLAPLAGPVADSSWLEAVGASEESPHKGFPLIENKQGTFMFLPKDFCLAEQLPELREMGLAYMRLDPSQCDKELTTKLTSVLLSDDASSAKDLWPNAVIRGFYGVNKSDVLFKKLKNPLRAKDKAMAEVLDARKGEPVTVRILDGHKLQVGMDLEMITPEGKHKEFSLKWIRDLEGNEIDSATENMIVTVPGLGSACAKALFLKSSKA